jgi:hypothetical protein
MGTEPFLDTALNEETAIMNMTPEEAKNLGTGISNILKGKFHYILDMANDLKKGEKLITKYNKPIGGFPMLVAKKDENTERVDLRITKGSRFIEFSSDTNELSQEDLNIEIKDHNYTYGYDTKVISESIEQSLVQLDKFEEDGTVRFEICLDCDIK